MRNIVLIIVLILTVGCGRRALQNGKEFNMQELNRLYSQNRVISASAPSKLNPPFIGYYRFDKDLLDFSRTIPNMLRETIRLTIRKLTKKQIEELRRLLHKKSNKEFEKYWYAKPVTKRQKRIHKEMGVSYYKRYIDFVDGLKCMSSVDSQNILADGVGARNYWTKCVYYANDNSVKALSIDYRFYFTYNKTKFQNSTTPSLRLHKLKEIQNLFKKDVKEIFDSIKIHDMDRVKMKKEGLLYDRQYEIQEY